MKVEVILTGSFGVGKSSLYDRIIYDQFTNDYKGTIGVRINERDLKYNNRSFTLLLWDIAGEVHQRKVPTPYFVGKNVILYVVDLSRPFTHKGIKEDIDYLHNAAPNARIVIVGNKKDIVTPEEIDKVKSNMAPLNLEFLTSAKTGSQVLEMFQQLGSTLEQV